MNTFDQGWEAAEAQLDKLPYPWGDQHEYWRAYAIRLMLDLAHEELRPRWQHPFHWLRSLFTHEEV